MEYCNFFKSQYTQKKKSNLSDFVDISSGSTIKSALRTQEVSSGFKITINDLMDATMSPLTDQNLIFYYFYYQT